MGDYPSSVVEIGGYGVVLIRRHVNGFALSLPIEGAWKVRSFEELSAAKAEIQAAIASQRPIVSMSDVAARMGPTWSVDFPGTPLPGEAWLSRGDAMVGLFQEEDGTRVVVWEGGTVHERRIAALAEMSELPVWVDEKTQLQLRAKAAAAERLAEEAAARAAVTPPEVEQVLLAMRDGVRFQIGGGRTFSTYVMTDDRIVRLDFDEGVSEEWPCSEQDLREAIARDADAFRQYVDRWAADRLTGGSSSETRGTTPSP